ncbi:hypothetical protein AS594_33810 [Streptomyces agglomeratus]|uniref:Uncharacterized protein n=1 Tax=Streptomyces agglomeratus TaxID=285458 RepID=A0A1E5PH56_9ACTN|nr:hypothetical protein AS594_33810 [Streptomyces agglomeratus]OEJ49779.1 hypothetical protein BGK72_02275 [Streptomyces agglomeratus]
MLRGTAQVQVGQRADLLPLALCDQPLHHADGPPRPLGGAFTVMVQHPLELRSCQRLEPPQGQHAVGTDAGGPHGSQPCALPMIPLQVGQLGLVC